jgi:hypothetical protein
MAVGPTLLSRYIGKPDGKEFSATSWLACHPTDSSTLSLKHPLISTRSLTVSNLNVLAYQGSKGLAAVRPSDSTLRVYVQLPDGSIQEVEFINNSWTKSAKFSDALLGTSITAFVDDQDQIHVLYQSNVFPYSIIEQHYISGTWVSST